MRLTKNPFKRFEHLAEANPFETTKKREYGRAKRNVQTSTTLLKTTRTLIKTIKSKNYLF